MIFLSLLTYFSRGPPLHIRMLCVVISPAPCIKPEESSFTQHNSLLPAIDIMCSYT